MNRLEAIETIKEIFETDCIGIRNTLSDEQILALYMALSGLENPESMSCGFCKNLVAEDMCGYGRCEKYGISVYCDNEACYYYEQRYELKKADDFHGINECSDY